MIRDEDINAVLIANYFLTRSKATPKKLQKLVYYSYSWFIAINNETEDDIESVLFAEQPEAWLHGPVFRSLYNEYRQYSWHEIDRLEDVIEFENGEIAPFLDRIYDTYNQYDADELEYMTHQEAPWKNARNGISTLDSSNNRIDLKDIFRYFNSLSNE